MTDDPVQPPEQKPVFLLPGESAPVAGLPPQPPVQPQGSQNPPAPSGAAAWPARVGVLSAVIGLGATFAGVIPLLIIWTVAGGDEKDPGFVIIATLLQAVIFMASGYFVARSVGAVRARDFGLRRVAPVPAIGKVFAIIAMYYVLFGIFATLVNLKADDAPQDLGAEDGALGMIAFAFVAALIAPVAEEIFFRGMVFRPLANRLGVWGGALISGIFFGFLHWDFATTDRLLQVVPLAGLGVLLAVLYAWSGTIYTAIAVHGFNNALAVAVFAGGEDSTEGIVAAVVCFALILTFCFAGPRFTDRDESPGPEAPGPPPPAPAWPNPAPVPAPQLPDGWLPPSPRPPEPPTTSFMLSR